MAAQLENNYMFDPRLVAQAISYPPGTFVMVDDLAMSVNGLGRKVVQTAVVEVDGKPVSVSYVDDDQTTYELVLATDHPVELGSYASLRASHAEAYDQLVMAFGGLGRFAVHEMVTALVRAQEVPDASPAQWMEYARRQVRRTAWVVAHRVDALVGAPVDWAAVGA